MYLNTWKCFSFIIKLIHCNAFTTGVLLNFTEEVGDETQEYARGTL